jgi:hypothetical protein
MPLVTFSPFSLYGGESVSAGAGVGVTVGVVGISTGVCGSSVGVGLDVGFTGVSPPQADKNKANINAIKSTVIFVFSKLLPH